MQIDDSHDQDTLAGWNVSIFHNFDQNTDTKKNRGMPSLPSFVPFPVKKTLKMKKEINHPSKSSKGEKYEAPLVKTLPWYWRWNMHISAHQRCENLCKRKPSYFLQCLSFWVQPWRQWSRPRVARSQLKGRCVQRMKAPSRVGAGEVRVWRPLRMDTSRLRTQTGTPKSRLRASTFARWYFACGPIRPNKLC